MMKSYYLFAGDNFVAIYKNIIIIYINHVHG
jgi:hypothetical protein